MLFFWTSVLYDKQRMLVEKLFREKHDLGISDDEGYKDQVAYSFENYRFYCDPETGQIKNIIKSLDAETIGAYERNEASGLSEEELISKADQVIMLIYGNDVLGACERTFKRYQSTYVSYDYYVDDIRVPVALFDFAYGRDLGFIIFYSGVPGSYDSSSFMSSQESFERARDVSESLVNLKYEDTGVVCSLDESTATGELTVAIDGNICWKWRLTYHLEGSEYKEIGFIISMDASTGQIIGCERTKAMENGDDIMPDVDTFVYRLYQICLGRMPDSNGYAAWKKILIDHVAGGKKVVYGFFFSKEFQNLELSNRDYVVHLYRAILGREPEAEGLSAWIAALENGHSRLKVFERFTKSVEFSNLCKSMGIIV